jgi:hypothetical protein
MLREIIRLAATHRSLRAEELAGELRTTPAFVGSALRELERLGYMQRLFPACDSPCQGCPLAAACALNGAPLAWTLTPVGRAFAERRASL